MFNISEYIHMRIIDILEGRFSFYESQTQKTDVLKQMHVCFIVFQVSSFYGHITVTENLILANACV